MKDLGLEAAGIRNLKKVYRNLSYEELYEHETSHSLVGFETAYKTEFGALSVDTGRFTGRSPKDKVFVVEDESRFDIWWNSPSTPTSDNKPITTKAWEHLHEITTEQLSGEDLYVVDGFAGANPETRLRVRIVTEVAWQAHFAKNMFIRPSEEELKDFEPDWTILNACRTMCPNYDQWNLNSEVFLASSIEERMTLIGGSWYGGEMKKGIFTIMNYFLPRQGIGSFHCSANTGKDGDTALFFGLSGTGKTTLSTDPKRMLIGDDEHGWDDDGIFNFEGGCYAKCVDLSKEKEPDIFRAIKRDALLENVVVSHKGIVDFADTSKTENTRVSYPIDHIDNIVKPISKGGHPSNIIFLTCDAFGILPPVSRLTREQAIYQFLSGYTAKVAGTELGVTEPQATFSTCFGAAFLALHPMIYAKILGEKMEQHKSKAFLVNTGWIGGPYGVGERMDITPTRAIIDAILDGSINDAEFENLPSFNLAFPKALPGVDPKVLNPRAAWSDKKAYDKGLKSLAELFVNNFRAFMYMDRGVALEPAGPQLD